jgi:hypothetical protein
MTNSSTPGIRNNNPGNIRRSDDKWQGLAQVQPDSQFFTFQSPVYGIRAIARLLINYQDKYSLNTIREIISRWAPPAENPTAAYIEAVTQRTGFDADEQLDMHAYENLRALVTAIIWQENGQQPYSDQQIDKALVLAGVEPAGKPLAQTNTMRGAQVTATAGAVAAASGVIAQAAPAMPVLSALAETVQQNALGMLIVVGAVMVAAAVYIAWERIDERRKGIS